MMEVVEINVCRTCLGKLDEVPRNIFQANFTDVLDVLRGFVDNLADAQTEDVFNVCSFCYEKLDYICTFKKQCQKSFDDYMEIKNRKVSLAEEPVISNLGQIGDDDYLSAKIDLNSENLEETITIYKNSEETNSTGIEPIETTTIEPIISSARRGSRAKQFPTQDVVGAIDKCTFYQTDVKNRKCIHCDHMAKINRQLCIHMKYKHAAEVRMWCSRCNIQTNDLEEHLKATRCSEYVCKFCNKKCRRLFMLMAHLKSHAFEHFAAQSKMAKISSQQEISESKDRAVAFPQREDSQQEKSLQQLSNVVFQYGNTVVDSVTKIDNTTIESNTNIVTTDGKIKVSRISKQYDSALVLQALAECTNYLRDMKNRICGHCNVVTTLSTGLNNHMLRTHSKFYPLWCNRCNVQTEDLQAHKDLVKCNTYSCKFCEKAFNKLNKLSKHLQCHCREIFRNKVASVADEEPTIQLQSLTSTSTSASNDQQQSGDGMAALETTDGNITYENSQEFFFTDANNVNASANMSYENDRKVVLTTEPADIKMDDNFDNTDGTMTYESSENTDGNITYESLENTDGKFSYEIKQETAEDTEMLTEITGSDTMEDPRDDSNVQDTTISVDDSASDECTDLADDDSHGSDGEESADWSLLEQIDPAEVIRALTSVRKPVQVQSTCIICKSAMTDNRGLSLHMTIVHKEERENWCRTCNDLFDDLIAHKEIHASKCEFCNKTFTFTSHLRSHLKNHARNHNFHTSTWIACKACTNIFPDEDLLNTHECTPDPSKVDHKTFCALCNEAVPALKDHIKEKHNADGASGAFHLCPACGKSVTSAYQLNIHMRKHTGELPYKCVHCDKSFATKHLMAHHEKLHTDSKQNVCHICSRPFATNAQLECHLMNHAGKSLKCSQCDQSFCYKAQLTSHMRQHTGEKPHLCTDCGRGFYNKTALASHSRHTHSEDRPYKCSYCDSSFKVKATLKTHEFIHTGIKPFKCSACSYSCRQSYRLTIHMKQHVDENKTAHTCMFCQERFATHLQLISHTYANHGEMPMDQVNNLNNLNAPTTTTTTPNVVNITSHHIIIPDGNNSQTIQIAGLDMLGGSQTVNMDSTSRGDVQLGLDRIGGDNTMDGNVAVDEIDNVPIQIVYKPQEMG